MEYKGILGLLGFHPSLIDCRASFTIGFAGRAKHGKAFCIFAFLHAVIVSFMLFCFSFFGLKSIQSLEEIFI